MRRPGIPSLILCVLCLLCVSALDGTAQAAPVVVSYSLSGSLVASIGGWDQLRPIHGRMTVVYQGTGSQTLSGPSGGFVGAAQIKRFDMTVDARVTNFNNVSFTGPVRMVEYAQPSGAFDGDLSLPLHGFASTFLPCHGGSYTCSGVAPALPVLLTLDGPLLDSSTPAPTVAGHVLHFDLGPVAKLFDIIPMSGNLTATEVGRTVVPEPDGAPRVALVVLLALTLWGGRQRFRIVSERAAHDDS